MQDMSQGLQVSGNSAALELEGSGANPVEAGFDEVVVVHGYGAEQVERELGLPDPDDTRWPQLDDLDLGSRYETEHGERVVPRAVASAEAQDLGSIPRPQGRDGAHVRRQA